VRCASNQSINITSNTCALAHSYFGGEYYFSMTKSAFFRETKSAYFSGEQKSRAIDQNPPPYAHHLYHPPGALPLPSDDRTLRCFDLRQRLYGGAMRYIVAKPASRGLNTIALDPINPQVCIFVVCLCAQSSIDSQRTYSASILVTEHLHNTIRKPLINTFPMSNSTSSWPVPLPTSGYTTAGGWAASWLELQTSMSRITACGVSFPREFLPTHTRTSLASRLAGMVGRCLRHTVETMCT
jgi:hypothetical protein